MRGDQGKIDEAHELLLQLDHPPRSFLVSIGNRGNTQPTREYSTQNSYATQQTFEIAEHASLILATQQHNQHINQRNIDGVVWQQLQTRPVSGESIKLRISSATQQVYAEIELTTLRNGQWHTVTRQLNGDLGRWIPIAAASETNERQWRTGSLKLNELYIKISPLKE